MTLAGRHLPADHPLPDPAAHRARLERRIRWSGSSPGALPDWLHERSTAMALRYAEVQTTAEFSAVLSQFQRLSDKPFELFIVGEGNFGKSTLLNALLGQELSQVHFLPETRAFLRFVPSTEPSSRARLFTRLNHPQHEWLASALGEGDAVPELFGAREHRTPLDKALRLLAEDTQRHREDAAHYEPGIVELEQEVQHSPSTLLPPNIRVVDTQGLNQLFPHELRAEECDVADLDTSGMLERWMATTARGRHLDWQLRRCDAVLWVAHARRPSSAATRLAMRYFGRYGKHSVLALTNIDGVNEGSRPQVLAEATELFGEGVQAVHPVDGRSALSAALGGDAYGVEASGLAELAATLRRAAIEEGARLRSQGAYNALRATERQVRGALRSFRRELDKNREQLDRDRKRVVQEREREFAKIGKATRNSSTRCLDKVAVAATRVGLSDGGYSAKQTIKLDDWHERHREAVSAAARAGGERAGQVAGELGEAPYTMPLFDAEGARSGDAVRVKVRVKLKPPRLKPARLQLDLDTQMWKSTTLWFKETVFGFFSARAKEEARAERSRLVRERAQDIVRQVRAAWSAHDKVLIEAAGNSVRASFGQVDRALTKVERRLESQEQRELAGTRHQVDAALEDVTLRPLVVSRLVGQLRVRLSGLGIRRRGPTDGC